MPVSMDSLYGRIRIFSSFDIKQIHVCQVTHAVSNLSTFTTNLRIKICFLCFFVVAFFFFFFFFFFCFCLFVCLFDCFVCFLFFCCWFLFFVVFFVFVFLYVCTIARTPMARLHG